MRILLTEEQLREGVGRMANEIRSHYAGRPLSIIGVLVGSLVLLADLIRRLDIPLRVDVVQGRSEPPARPRPLVVSAELTADIRGRHVLLVDDIFHTGNTLAELVPQIDELGAASVHTAVLLRKEGTRTAEIEPNFVGFTIPDVFVVGFGLDHRDLYRNLPFVAALEPEELG